MIQTDEQAAQEAADQEASRRAAETVEYAKELKLVAGVVVVIVLAVLALLEKLP